ncbi:PQQ-dependent sugar dehydrogenase [Chloroflexi bacterium CFX2]|nr:PQQ-dependent sugar dehydrogenase [Chloroflexi bacterium CFX2]
MQSPAALAQAADPPSVPKNVTFVETVSGLDDPLFVTHAGDGSGRLFIVQRTGKILIFKNGALNSTPFLDVGGIITTSGGEQGLLGLAFDPDYRTNGKFYVVYTVSENNAVKLARYRVSGTDSDLAETNGEVLLSINKAHTNHNGGMIAFGPDGYLYMAVGDGGGGGDPGNNGQSKNTLLGKILRLDVSGTSYTIPLTNPFVGEANAREEIWAYGLRNPWRFSFDRTTGDIFIGDVGQNAQEEIDFQPFTSGGGENYGWRILEGNLCYNSQTCTPPPDYVPPVAVYDHGPDDSFGCSVTGGYVYRGSQFPALQGVYLYGDFCKGKVWGLIKNGSGGWTSTLIADTDFLISSFGEDEAGELYLTDYATGGLYRIAEAPLIKKGVASNAGYDGYLRESSASSGRGGAMNTTATTLKLGDDTENRQYRAVLSFNTASLPDNAVIVSAVLKFKYAGGTGTLPFDSHGDLLADIRRGAFNNNVNTEPGDFAAAADKNSVLRYTNVTVNGWYSKKLGAANLDYINKQGVTQFRLRFAMGDDNDSTIDLLRVFSGDGAPSDRPRLIVTYFLP